MKWLITSLFIVTIITSCMEAPLKIDTAVNTLIENRRINFNSDWKFIKADLKNAHEYGFDDTGWRNLDLPHDWAIEGPFTKDVLFNCGFLPFPGTGWYRKHFTVSDSSKNYLIEFDGAMRDAKVFLNGEFIGEWPYGYSSFAFDLTPHLKFGEENVLAVRLHNMDKSSRWYPGSGIYRNVWLTTTNPVHVAHWGTFVSTPDVFEDEAIVKVETKVVNNSDSSKQIKLRTSIVDQYGEVITFNEIIQDIGADSPETITQTFEMEDPERWDIDSPYLYAAVSTIYENDAVVDASKTRFGVRNFYFDPNKGFFLNGRHLKLKGVNLHHGLGPLGIAINKRAIERQLEIMKEMGINAIRTAHNPPAPEQLDLCDEMGILVIDETFDEWTVGKIPNGYNLLFDEWSEKDTRALLLRDRNHPSIILWSVGNEIPELDTESGIRNAEKFVEICHELDPYRPVTAGIHLSTSPERVFEIFDVAGLNYWQDRYNKLHEQFPGVPLLPTETSAVTSSRGVYHFPVRVPDRLFNKTRQITSYDKANCDFGTLPDNNSDEAIQSEETIPVTGKSLEYDRYKLLFKDNGNLIVSGGRFGDGSEGRYRQEGDRVFVKLVNSWTELVYDGKKLTEVDHEAVEESGYDKSMQITAYDITNIGFGNLPDLEFCLQENNRFLAGEFVWSGFDYHGEPDPFEDMWPAHSSYFGIVDMCGFKKDRFYLYQSQWTDEPMVHILPHWNWKGREGETTPVFVYSNCDSTELFVNGASMGIRKKVDGAYRMIWEDVVYQPGSIRAVAYVDDDVAVEKEIKTAGDAAGISLSVDRASINTDKDLAFITVKITDKDDNFCPTAENKINFSIKGAGEIIAVGNGNPISHESYQGNTRTTFNGLCLAILRSGGKAGSIEVEATSPGLASDKITIAVN